MVQTLFALVFGPRSETFLSPFSTMANVTENVEWLSAKATTMIFWCGVVGFEFSSAKSDRRLRDISARNPANHTSRHRHHTVLWILGLSECPRPHASRIYGEVKLRDKKSSTSCCSDFGALDLLRDESPDSFSRYQHDRIARV